MGANWYDGSERGSHMVTSRTSIIHILYDENTPNHDIALILLPWELSLPVSIATFWKIVSLIRKQHVLPTLFTAHIDLFVICSVYGKILPNWD